MLNRSNRWWLVPFRIPVIFALVFICFTSVRWVNSAVASDCNGIATALTASAEMLAKSAPMSPETFLQDLGTASDAREDPIAPDWFSEAKPLKSQKELIAHLAPLAFRPADLASLAPSPTSSYGMIWFDLRAKYDRFILAGIGPRIDGQCYNIQSFALDRAGKRVEPVARAIGCNGERVKLLRFRQFGHFIVRQSMEPVEQGDNHWIYRWRLTGAEPSNELEKCTIDIDLAISSHFSPPHLKPGRVSGRREISMGAMVRPDPSWNDDVIKAWLENHAVAIAKRQLLRVNGRKDIMGAATNSCPPSSIWPRAVAAKMILLTASDFGGFRCGELPTHAVESETVVLEGETYLIVAAALRQAVIITAYRLNQAGTEAEMVATYFAKIYNFAQFQSIERIGDQP